MRLGSFRVVAFIDWPLDFGIVDGWGCDWKTENVGTVIALGPVNVVLEMVQDKSIRVLDVLWAFGSALKALPSLFEDRDPLAEPEIGIDWGVGPDRTVMQVFSQRDGEITLEDSFSCTGNFRGCGGDDGRD